MIELLVRLHLNYFHLSVAGYIFSVWNISTLQSWSWSIVVYQRNKWFSFFNSSCFPFSLWYTCSLFINIVDGSLKLLSFSVQWGDLLALRHVPDKLLFLINFFANLAEQSFRFFIFIFLFALWVLIFGVEIIDERLAAKSRITSVKTIWSSLCFFVEIMTFFRDRTFIETVRLSLYILET